MTFKPIDDAAIEPDYATDSSVLDRIRLNQRAVWDGVGDVLVQQLDRITRTSWEWAVVWATPWYWYPSDKTVEGALLTDSVFDSDGLCEIETCFVFTELGGTPSFDLGVRTFNLIEDTEILEVETPEYMFSGPRFGFLQLWIRCPNQPEFSDESSAGPVLISLGGESARTGDVDVERRQIRDFDDIKASFGGFEDEQLVIALKTTQDSGGSLSAGSGEIWRANVCQYSGMIYWQGAASPPTNTGAWCVDREPPSGLIQYTYEVWAYAGLKPHQIGLRINRHEDRGWFTARQDQIQTGQTQTQIAFTALTEGDRALYGMRRPWALWYEAPSSRATPDVPLVRLYPCPRHADRLRHRFIGLVVAWERFTTDATRVPVTLRAEMVEPDEDTGIDLYGTWAGQTEVQAPKLISYNSDLDWPLNCMTMAAHTWQALIEQAVIASPVFGRDPGDPGAPLGAVRVYLLRLTTTVTQFRTSARVVFGSVWSEEV
jgi:hypothetical protein